MKIYSTLHDFLPGAVQLLKESGHEVELRDKSLERPDEDELCELVENYDGLIIGIKEKMTSKVYTHSKNLKFVGTLSVGVDHIDQWFFKDKNIKVINCAYSNVPSVAEFSLGLMLSLLKKFDAQDEFTKGKTETKPNSIDLYGKYLGIVGAGNIAQNVIKIAEAFGMSIICWTFNPDKHKDLDVRFLPLDELFEVSEIISIHLPSTDQSKGMINKDLISRMKKDAILINTSRTNIVDNDALISALENNRIAGAAIDGDFDSEFIKRAANIENLILTSHVAGSNSDADQRIDMDMANQIVIKFPN